MYAMHNCSCTCVKLVCNSSRSSCGCRFSQLDNNAPLSLTDMPRLPQKGGLQRSPSKLPGPPSTIAAQAHRAASTVSAMSGVAGQAIGRLQSAGLSQQRRLDGPVAPVPPLINATARSLDAVPEKRAAERTFSLKRMFSNLGSRRN